MKKYIYIIVLANFLFACSTSSQEESDQSKMKQASIVNEDNTEEVIITKDQFKKNNMALGKPQTIDFPEYIEVNGMIDVPPTNKASISPIMGGYVHSFNLLEGNYVKKGQVLFSLKNPDFINLQEQFLETMNSLEYLKSDYERQKQLKEEQITSVKKYLKAKSDYQSALSRYHSLEKQLQLLNINPKNLKPGKIRSVIYIIAPLSGYVTDINIEKGIYLEPAQIAMKVVNNQHKHIEMKVFEKDVQKIKVGQDILFYQPDYPQNKYTGEVHLIGKNIDPKNRTVNVHGHMKEEGRLKNLLPGMFVAVKIATKVHKATVVPETAIVEEEGEKFILLKQKEEKGQIVFIPLKVETGKSWNNLIEIKNPTTLPQNAEILTQGGYFIKVAGGEE